AGGAVHDGLHSFAQAVVAAVLHNADNAILFRWLRTNAELLSERVLMRIEALDEQLIDNDRSGFRAHVAALEGAPGQQWNAECLKEAIANAVNTDDMRIVLAVGLAWNVYGR